MKLRINKLSALIKPRSSQMRWFSHHFRKSTQNNCAEVFFFDKAAGPWQAPLLKRDSKQVLFYEFSKCLRGLSLQNNSGGLLLRNLVLNSLLAIGYLILRTFISGRCTVAEPVYQEDLARSFISSGLQNQSSV